MTPQPVIMTENLLRTIRTHSSLPRNTWYFIAGTTLSALNRPEEIPIVFRHALDKGGDGVDNRTGSTSIEEQLRIARRLREALIKATAVYGLPKSINALFELKKATPASLLDEPLTFSPSGRQTDFYDTPSSHLMQRGQSFFDRIYGKVSARVMRQMDRSGTEDLGLVARLMYGYVLSNTRILSPAESSYVLLASLIPQDVNAQLKGHLVGATHHEGVTVENVRAVRDIVIKICKASGMQEKLGDSQMGGWGWRDNVADL